MNFQWSDLLAIFSPYLVAAAVAYIVGQLAKIVIQSFKKHGFSWRELFQSGSMPSTHTASVAALVTVIGLKDGLGSPIFAVAFIFLLVVAYDAMRVRRAVGEQGEILRAMIDRDARQEKEIARLTPEDDKPGKKLTKPYFARGHKPIEVFVGGVLGILVGIIVTIMMR
jgi:acid phosphatase family membrane protein YuiD